MSLWPEHLPARLVGGTISIETPPSPSSPPPGRAERAQGAAGNHVPSLANGVELMGEYEGSGYKEPRYLARRSDGQLIQLTALLYMVAEEIDGKSDFEEIARKVGDRYGRAITADNVETLITKSLLPDGFIAGPDGAQPELKKPDPLLALKFKITVLPQGAVNLIAGMLRPLFWPPVIVAALVGLGVLDVWYFGIHGVGQSLRDLIYQPLIVLMIYGLLIVSIGWHELGHATACRYGGARSGRIGFGIYIVWPAFFTDVTDALKLGKSDRVRTDLGGMYFNVLFSLAIGGVYFLTGFEPLLVLIVMQHLLMLYNLMPFLRLDGYHAISDITGIPDLFGRIKPTVKGLAPWKETPDAVTELKPWARNVVTAWVLIAVPVLLVAFGMMVLSVPRVVATGWDSLLIQWNKIQEALGNQKLAQASVGGIQAAMIVLPTTGMFVTLSRTSKRIATGAWNMTSERPVLRSALGLVGVAAIGAAIFVLIPNGEYKPIQPDEDWTFSDSVEAASAITTGRPSLTEEQQTDLGGAGSVHDGDTDFEPSYGGGSDGTSSSDTSGDTSDDTDSSDSGDTEPSPAESPSESPTESPSPTPS
jgi:putative peptide zinc metalloprotease protein